VGTAEDLDRAEEAMALVAHLRGEWRQGLQIELRRSGVGSFTAASDVHQCIGQFHLYSDELSRDAEQYARRTLRRATDAGNVRVQAFAWCLLGESLLLRGYFDEAAGCLEHSAELHATLGSDSGAAAWQRLAELAASQGRLHEVSSALRRASVIATVSPMARHLWGRIHATAAFAWLQQGEPARAAQSIRAASTSATRYGDCRSCGALLHPVAAETYALIGEPAEAQIHASAARATADAFGGSAWSAMAESAAGSAALAVGDTSSAGTHFHAAAGYYDAIEHHFWAAHSRRQALALPVS
jgi:tetratricopeptide (TPR) repeat protein